MLVSWDARLRCRSKGWPFFIRLFLFIFAVMRRLSLLLACLFLTGIIVSCGDPLATSVKMSANTGNFSHLTSIGAVIEGNVKCSGDGASDGLEMGVLYSENSGVLLNTATRLQASPDSIVWEGNRAHYSVRLKFIKRETTYYYRCYVSRDGVIEYGKTKSFTTKSINSLIQTGDVSDIGKNGVCFHGIMDLTDIEYSSVDYGFRFIKTRDSSDYYWNLISSLYTTYYSIHFSDGLFSADYNYLEENTEYSYYAFVTIDNRHYQGEVKTFTTQ